MITPINSISFMRQPKINFGRKEKQDINGENDIRKIKPGLASKALGIAAATLATLATCSHKDYSFVDSNDPMLTSLCMMDAPVNVLNKNNLLKNVKIKDLYNNGRDFSCNLVAEGVDLNIKHNDDENLTNISGLVNNKDIDYSIKKKVRTESMIQMTDNTTGETKFIANSSSL